MAYGVTVYGTNGDDMLGGTDNDDQLIGLDGNDFLDGGLGADMMAGGLGNDTYWVRDEGDQIIENEWEGYDTVYAYHEVLLDGLSIERLVLAGTGMTGIGNNWDNNIVGMAGDNYIEGRGGNDLLQGGAGRDKLFGGDGDDTIMGGTEGDLVHGGAGIDTADYEDASKGVTVSLAITTAQNTGMGFDRLVSIENLNGSLYDDVLIGNDRSNVLYGNTGTNILDGGAGRDTADYHRSSVGVSLDLTLTGSQYTGTGYDTLLRIENLHGSGYGDTLSGSGASNTLWGDCGDDVLNGRGGNDILIGGQGSDRMIGGTGADRFVFTLADAGGLATVDFIDDFSQSQHDRIDLSGFDADLDHDGIQDFAYIGNAAFSGTAGELRWEATNGSTIVTVDLDGDMSADFYLMIGGTHTLTSADFLF